MTEWGRCARVQCYYNAWPYISNEGGFFIIAISYLLSMTSGWCSWEENDIFDPIAFSSAKHLRSSLLRCLAFGKIFFPSMNCLMTHVKTILCSNFGHHIHPWLYHELKNIAEFLLHNKIWIKRELMMPFLSIEITQTGKPKLTVAVSVGLEWLLCR